MCGIAGIILRDNSFSLKEKIVAMSQTIKHRGPDGEGFAMFNGTNLEPFYSEETPLVNQQSSQFKFNPTKHVNDASIGYTFAFAHRRLSIIDLSESGHQPMCDETTNHWITFNGEIYNYIELRNELKGKGHYFVTQTDTEVVIAAYKEWGVDCLQRFNGMWAFALFDKTNNQIFCARDRVGVKPFYYTHNNSLFAFASEYKAFIKSGIVKFEINKQQQFDFLINETLETDEESLFKGIKELKPAHYLLYDLNKHQFKINSYYAVNTKAFCELSDVEIIHKVEEKLINSVKLRLRSDVEVGSCLSGGLDSSIIAGIIRFIHPKHGLKLFTAVFPGEKFDETNYAQLAADYVNGDWKTVNPKADEFFNDINALNYFQDLPVWSTSTYSQHRVMQLAQQSGVKVVLDGQGADELFAGYGHHYYSYWKENFGFGSLQKIHDAKPTINNPYLFFMKEQAKEMFGLKKDYSKYFSNHFKVSDKEASNSFSSTLNEQLKTDYNGRLKSFLKCEDRCSMAFGIESRVPFADDVDLVDFIFSVKGNKKIQKGISKFILREATKKYIPQEIYTRRDKIGFQAPVSDWLLKFRSHVMDVVSQISDIININYINNNFEQIVKKNPNFLLRAYSYAIWKQVYSAL